MSSSYAAAISALRTLNSPDTPGSSSSGPAGIPTPSPRFHKIHKKPAVEEEQPPPPDPLRTYEEQQENPEDYGIGRQ